MNLQLEYMYRDASNYKRYGEVVLANPGLMSVEEVWEGISKAVMPWQIFPDVVHFRPERVGLPTCYFSEVGFGENEDDLDLHELIGISLTEAAVTEDRTVGDLLEELRVAARVPAGEDCVRSAFPSLR